MRPNQGLDLPQSNSDILLIPRLPGLHSPKSYRGEGGVQGGLEGASWINSRLCYGSTSLGARFVYHGGDDAFHPACTTEP